MKNYYVYILASKKNGTLYTGITSNLIKRVYEHKNSFVDGFTEKYSIKNLVYFEIYADPENAILRENRIKKWSRQWKINIIQRSNPEWKDLYETIA